MDSARAHRRPVAVVAGLLAGGLAGVAMALLTAGAVAGHVSGAEPGVFVEAAHVPPLLSRPGERVELRYDIYCVPRGEDVSDVDAACDAGGTVFARAGDAGAFQPFPLRVDPAAEEGKYVASLPNEIAQSRDGFSYYAVLQDRVGGATLVLPAGGASAPDRSLPMGRAVEVRLGAHRFGVTQPATARVAAAAWGDGPSDVGLEQGRNLPPIGGTSFDVRGTAVYLLDEAHRRVQRWQDDPGRPAQLPLAVDGTLADMSVADDGSIYVLESASALNPAPSLRVFAANGQLRSEGDIAEQTASQVRVGPSGPVVLAPRSNEWIDGARDGSVIAPAAQAASGRSGRPLPGGDRVIVLRQGREIRAAVIGKNGTRRAWDVTSTTPLAEVQLAEPLGKLLVLVARVYTDTADEFVVLVLGANGVVRSFALDPADWAETAPLSRFRLAGSSLYQLGSRPAGIFVDRFDLGVR